MKAHGKSGRAHSGRNSVIRTTDALSLATWFGGSLMGAIGLRRAAGESDHEAVVEGKGWQAWQPVQATAIGAQLASGAALTIANRRRLVSQRGVGTLSLVRTALTGAAIGATVLAARSGRELEQRMEQERNVGHDPAAPDGPTAGLERKTRALQWSVPALTGALLAVDAVMGEQQRPGQVARGTLRRVLPDVVADRVAA